MSDEQTDHLQLLRKRGQENRHVALLNKLRLSENHRATFSWPGIPELSFQLCALTCSEAQEAVAAAWQRFKDLDLEVTPLLAEEWSAEEITQRLYLAIRELDNHEQRMFANAKELRDHSSEPARYEIWQDLDEIEKSIASNFNELTPAVLEEIDDAIKKKDVERLRSFGRNMLAIYTITMVSQQLELQTPKSTSGQESVDLSSIEQMENPEPAEPSTPAGK